MNKILSVVLLVIACSPFGCGTTMGDGEKTMLAKLTMDEPLSAVENTIYLKNKEIYDIFVKDERKKLGKPEAFKVRLEGSNSLGSPPSADYKPAVQTPVPKPSPRQEEPQVVATTKVDLSPMPSLPPMPPAQ